MSINRTLKYNEFMEYKRMFLLRYCNTAIVKFLGQLTSYREPLCKFEKSTPTLVGDAALWGQFGKQSLGWTVALFCPIGWMPLCNTQTALPEEATQLLWEMSAGTKELKLEVLVLLEDI